MKRSRTAGDASRAGLMSPSPGTDRISSSPRPALPIRRQWRSRSGIWRHHSISSAEEWADLGEMVGEAKQLLSSFRPRRLHLGLERRGPLPVNTSSMLTMHIICRYETNSGTGHGTRAARSRSGSRSLVSDERHASSERGLDRSMTLPRSALGPKRKNDDV